MRIVSLTVLLLMLCPKGLAAADWKSFYADLRADARVPAFAHTDTSLTRWTLQDDYIDLGAALSASGYDQARPPFTEIYADVVHIGAGYTQTLQQQQLTIIARRIELDGDATFYLDHSQGTHGSVAFYAAEWTGKLRVIGSATLADPATRDIVEVGGDEALGVVVKFDGTHTARQSADALPGAYFTRRDALGRGLDRSLLAASTLPLTAASDRLALLDWVLRVSSQAPDLGPQSRFASVASESAALVSFWRAYAQGGYVPELDRDVYRDVGAAYLDAVERYETQYERFSDQATSTDQRMAAAQLMLSSAHAAVQQKEAYLDQARYAADAATDTVRQAERRLESRRVELEIARHAFEAGIEIWKQQQTIAGVLSGIELIIGFTAAAAGGEAGLAGEGAALKNLEALAVTIADVSIGLAASMSALSHVVELDRLLAAASRSFSGALEQGDTQKVQAALHDLADMEQNFVFTSEEWQRYALESRSLLTFAVNQEIRGAPEYQAELEGLAVTAQALLEAQRQEVRAKQSLAQLLLALDDDEAAEARIQSLLDRYKNDASVERELAASFVQRMVELKRPVYLSLLDYTAAYEYWALAKLPMPLTLLDDTAAYRTQLARLDQAYARALRGFSSPPQKFGNVRMVVSDPEQIARFRETGELDVQVGTGAAAFRGLGRVRLDAVRVWFEGAQCPDDRCLAQIRTSGSYTDRLAGQTYAFQGPSLSRIFEYELDARGQPTVIVDGQLADEFAFAYFQPTPFTEWSVSLSDAQNPGVDRGSVTRVIFEWAGSAIGAP